jgi:amino acid transporter
LKAAGPGGVVIGLLIGGASMVCAGLSYGELAARFSAAGGEFLYAIRNLGQFAGFMVGWFLTLYAVSICAFECCPRLADARAAARHRIANFILSDPR